jgi:hypothetical protein
MRSAEKPRKQGIPSGLSGGFFRVLPAFFASSLHGELANYHTFFLCSRPFWSHPDP